MVNNNTWIIVGSSLCLMAVILGAFGAHGLKAMLSQSSLSSFEVGIRYQFYHGLALIVIAIVGKTYAVNVNKAAQFIAMGVLLFSISIFFLSCKSLLPFSVSWLGPVTPIGGMLMIVGWIIFLIKMIKEAK